MASDNLVVDQLGNPQGVGETGAERQFVEGMEGAIRARVDRERCELRNRTFIQLTAPAVEPLEDLMRKVLNGFLVLREQDICGSVQGKAPAGSAQSWTQLVEERLID